MCMIVLNSMLSKHLTEGTNDFTDDSGLLIGYTPREEINIRG